MMRGVVLLLGLVICAAGQVEETPVRRVRWCVPYDQPPAFARLCTQALAAANTEDLAFECVVGGSFGSCFQMIQDGEADVTTADGGDAFVGHSEFGIEPLLYENYDVDVGTEYYAVAVVNRDFCTEETTLADLRGVDSCHTGYRKTAGWFMPMGTLLDASLLTPVREVDFVEDDAETMEAFFGSVCAPRVSGNGPANGEDGGGVKWDALCVTCGGDCSTHDKYYDYQGAFRCLMEGAGQVAFVKHSTVPDFAADGAVPEPWSTKNMDEFMLLCRDGGCAEIQDYEDCHLAKVAPIAPPVGPRAALQVPSHSVVADASMTFGGVDFEFGQQVQQALVTAIEEDPEFLARITEIGEQENFLVKAGTVELTPVLEAYDDSVGDGARSAFEGVTAFFRET